MFKQGFEDPNDGKVDSVNQVKIQKQTSVCSNAGNQNNLFITSCQTNAVDSTRLGNEPRKNYLSPNSSGRNGENMKTTFSGQFNNSKNNLALISEYEREIEKVKIFAGCDSV